MNENHDLIIVGAGAAGMLAAVSASLHKKRCLILEKNKFAGKKMLITGKGRCNITNSADIEQIVANFPANGKFLYSSLYTFSNYDMIRFLNDNGLKTKEERGGRIFPVSDRAPDVVKTILNFLKKHNVLIKYNNPVKDLIIKDNKVCGVITDKGKKYYGKSVVIATGGKSYPKTGSTGDGYILAKKAGHIIKKPEPALVPLYTKESFVKDLQGLSLKNIRINFISKSKKEVYSDFGEMIFTHFGISGPTVLTGGRVLSDYGYNQAKVVIDMKPALNDKKLDNRILRDFDKYSNKMYKNSLNDLLPSKMIPVFVKLSGINPDTKVNQITTKQRKDMIRLFKNFTLTVKRPAPVEQGIVTKGGISIKQVNPATMESQLISGLYFCGEVLDIDGFTGGYNLTAAFSTGYTAGYNICNKSEG